MWPRLAPWSQKTVQVLGCYLFLWRIYPTTPKTLTPLNPPPTSSTRRSARIQLLLTVCTPLRRALRTELRSSSDRDRIELRSSSDRAQTTMNMTKKMNWRARPRRSYEESSDSKRQPATGRQRGGACWRVLARAGARAERGRRGAAAWRAEPACAREDEEGAQLGVDPVELVLADEAHEQQHAHVHRHRRGAPAAQHRHEQLVGHLDATRLLPL